MKNLRDFQFYHSVSLVNFDFTTGLSVFKMFCSFLTNSFGKRFWMQNPQIRSQVGLLTR